MNDFAIQYLIDHYTKDDYDWIKSQWNGKHGDDFHDENYHFRMKVAELVCDQLDTVNLELLRDLFITIGELSKPTFGIYYQFHLLAETLLERGGKTYLLDYLRIAPLSFDAFISTGRIRLSKEKATEILNYFNELKITEKDSEIQNLLSDHMRERFTHLLDTAENCKKPE